MANVIYPKWKEAASRSSANSSLETGDIKVLAVTSGYTYSAAHEFLSDVAGGAVRVVTFPNLATKTYTNGTFDAGDVTTSSTVSAGSTITGYIVFIDTGVESTSRLVDFLNTVTGLPVNTNGSSVKVIWPVAGIHTL